MTVETEPTQANSPKRVAILDQAIAAFAKEGFRGTDVQVIADRSGVGKGTVYRYFGHKEDLFSATVLEVLNRLSRHLDAAMTEVEGAVEKLRAAADAYAGFFDAQPDCLEIFVQDRAEFRGHTPDDRYEFHEHLIDRFAAVIEEGIARGEIRPIDPRQTVIALGGLLYGSVVHSCYLKHESTLTEQAQYAVDVFLTGIRAAPAGQTPDALRSDEDFAP